MTFVLPDLTLAQIIGLFGAFTYICSYLLTAFDRLPSQSPYYYAMKGVAAAMVMVSLFGQFNMASAVIQSFFLLVSCIGVLRHVARREKPVNRDVLVLTASERSFRPPLAANTPAPTLRPLRGTA